MPKIAQLSSSEIPWQDATAYVLQPHNEHWVVFSKLLYLIDLTLFSYSGSFLIGVSLLMQALVGVLLTALFYSASNQARTPSLLFGALSLAMLFSLAQSENFVSTFQTAFIGCFLFSIGAVYAFAKYVQSNRSALLAISITTALLATLSLTAGIFSWLTLAAFAQVAGRRRVKWYLIGTFIFFFVFYLLTYQSQASPVNNLFGNPLKFVHYQLAIIGNIAGDVRLAGWLGAFGAIAYSMLAFLMLRVRRPRAPGQWALFLVCTFVLVTGFLISLGRVSLGVEQALSSRYMTPTFIFWACLIANYWLMARTQEIAGVGKVAAPIALLLCGYFIANNGKYINGLYAFRASQLEVANAIAAGSYKADPTILGRLANSPELIASQIDFLRTNRLSLFSSAEHATH